MSDNSIHFDVVIVGAGLSGIGAACHLRHKCPDKTFVLLEGRKTTGGTWDLFRYPGVRSDSDMHTLGYSFKPWLGAKAIADGPSILDYVREAAVENDIDQHVRFEHKVTSAAWSTSDARWTVQALQTSGGEAVTFTCNMLFMCGGYYNYDKGYTPEFEGMDDFTGQLVHPQEWPENLDYADKKVVVIGSGATAMTLVPAMAHSGAEQITMVQRSPTYVVSMPDQDAIANFLRKILPDRIAYALTRWKNINLQRYFYERMRAAPQKAKTQLLNMIRKHLSDDYVDQHFSPSYNPWDQRLCLIPNADLFKAIHKNKASIVTSQIDRFTAKGLKLKSGEELPADIVVTATGLNLTVLSGVTFSLDGRQVHLPDTFAYKGMMYSDIPNMVQTFGYVNASWTLRADLTAEYFCRLVKRMDELGMRQCTPKLSESEAGMQTRDWIDTFNPGYMKRSMHLFPKQGAHEPWINTQSYKLDKKMIRGAPLEDGALQFTNPVPDTPHTSKVAEQQRERVAAA